jgi:tetratricopeptide (TPR) repeat protein
MKPNGKIAAVVVLSCAVVGCSKRGDAKKTTAGNATPNAAASVSESPGAGKAVDDEGFVGTPLLTVKGPVSFADGEAAFQSRNYGEATKLFEQYIQRRPDNPWGHYMRGLSAWKSGDLVTSEESFETALRIDPKHMKSLVNLSRVLIEQKRYDDAIGKLTTAGEVDPESATVPRLMARAHSAKGEFEQAVDAYRHAIALDGSDAWSMNNLGMLYLERGFVEDALAYLAKAVQMNEKVAAFHNNLGMALEHQGRFVAAATAYKGALTADPGYKKAKQNLVRVEAVKAGPEEPFDLAAVARGTDEDRKVASDDARASK